MKSAGGGGAHLVGGFFTVLLGIGACHRVGATTDPRPSAECRAAQRNEQRYDDGRIRIDGSGSFSLHRGDSLVVLVNDREWWRGVYDPCRRVDGLENALRRAVPATDSVLSTQFLVGRDLGAAYHVGGRAGVLLLRTAPPPE